VQNLGAYLLGAAFWLFLGACAVAGIVTDYKRRRLGVEVVRAAIEKGHQLDAALIEKLTASPHDREQRIEPMHLKLGGVITIATGIGLAPVSYLVGTVFPVAFYPILGLAVLAVCVGVGLLIGAQVVARASEREHTGSKQP
jgi:hypothetical protein